MNAKKVTKKYLLTRVLILVTIIDIQGSYFQTVL